MKSLFEALQTVCSQFKSKTAVVDFHTGASWTYEALEQAINTQIRLYQTSLPVSPGLRVGLLAYNQIESIIHFFALQALGVIVVPLNWRLSVEELSVISANAGLTGVVLHPDFVESSKPLLSLLEWYSLTDAPLQEALKVELPKVKSTETAVLIYTSGTTGQPKGVMLSHQNLLADAIANIQVVEVCQEDVLVTCSPLFHVFGLTNVLLTALLSGATVVLVKRFNPKQVLEAISQYQVTFLAAVPTMYQMMLSLLPQEMIDLSSLRVCHSGAAPMHLATFQQVESVFGAPVQEGYGQSEASSIVTSNPLRGVRKPGSIGLPLEGLTVEIVDEEERPLPPFETGELRVKGPTVMQGYWQNPEATEKTVRSGWLYTADIGYQDDDGYLFLVGRRDDMMNVGGSKVYPKEVEDVLYTHPAIQACAVKGEESVLYGQVVTAYLVLHPGRKVLLTELQKYCREHLAEYKVPKTIYCVAEIPKSPSGKVLRNDLNPKSSKNTISTQTKL